MSQIVKPILTRNDAFGPAVTAVGVAVAIIALQLVQTFLGWISTMFQGGLFGPSLSGSLVVAIPFAIGFFVGLWLVAPITANLRIGLVIVRAIIATALGSAVVLLVFIVLAVTGSFSFDQALFGNSLPQVFDPLLAWGGVIRAVTSALGTFVSSLPLGVLAGVLLWVWRRSGSAGIPSPV